jgi:glucokinase
MTTPYWFGVDLGGTKILTGLFDSSLHLVAKAKQATDAEQGGQAVFQRIVQSVHALMKEHEIPAAQVGGICLAIPGQVVPSERLVKYAPNLAWRNFDLKPLIPTTWTWPLFVDNDVRMGTYGEWVMGAAKDAKHVFGIFAGTGVGGGLILNGELFHGFNGHAGEIGHIVVHWRKGTELEAVAGRKSMLARATEMLNDSPKRVRKEWKNVDIAGMKSSHLAEFYQRDDPIAVQLIDDAARAIGAAIASVINLLSPEVIVIGGGVAGALGDSFRERIWEIALRFALPHAADNVKCLAAALGDDSGIVGAAAYAKRHAHTG